MTYITLHPEQILFSQDTISSTINGKPLSKFINWRDGKPGLETTYDEPLPRMQITEYQSKFYTLYDRVLYCLKHSNINSVKVELVDFKKCRNYFLKKFNASGDFRTVRVRGYKEITKLDIGKMCMQSDPSQYICDIYYRDESRVTKRLFGPKILQLLIDNKLKVPEHLRVYISKERLKFLDQDAYNNVQDINNDVQDTNTNVQDATKSNKIYQIYKPCRFDIIVGIIFFTQIIFNIHDLTKDIIPAIGLGILASFIPFLFRLISISLLNLLIMLKDFGLGYF